MNLSRVFILRPVATTLLMIAIVLVGIISFRYLPISALPQVDYPTIQVKTFYPGASPDVMTTAITAPLEFNFGGMTGLEQMVSQSSGGASVITLRFALATDLDEDEQEVQAAITQSNSLLPTDLPSPPVYSKINPADAPVITLGVTSRTMDLVAVQDAISTRLAQKLSQIGGVGSVEVSGGHVRAIRVQLNQRALYAYGLSPDNIRTTIANVNVNSPSGGFDGRLQSTTLREDSQITDPATLANQVVTYLNGAPVRIRDVGRVVVGPENKYLAAWANKTPALVVNVMRQPGANVIKTVDAIKRALPSLTAALPAGIDVTPLSDRTITIRASVNDVEFELGLAVLLVVAVIFVFLRSARATLIPSLSVPLSLIGTLAVMYLLGYSLDNLSLMSLTIASGFVVDDAIVMIENISRFLEEGMEPREAALVGSGQIGFTIVSLTVSLIAVLIPLLFMGDVTGRLFHEFAVVLGVTIVISAVVSLTLVPMLCAKLLRHLPAPEYGDRQAARKSWATRMFDGLIGGYHRALLVVLDNQGVTLVIAAATLAGTVLLYVVIPKGFFPSQDTGLIQGVSIAPQTVSFSAMGALQQRMGAAILTDPEVASVSSFIGIDGTNTTLNQGRFEISLKPRDQRTLSADAIIARLATETANVPGMRLTMQPVQDLTLSTETSAARYQFVLMAPTDAQLAAIAPRVLDALAKRPELADVADDLQGSGRGAMITIDRATAARFGITPATVDNALYDAFGQRQVSTIYTQSSQYRIIQEADPSLGRDLQALNQIYLSASGVTSGTSSGSATGATPTQVPLSAIVSVAVKPMPLLVTHLGQFPATTVSFNLAHGVSLGSAVEAVHATIAGLHLPASAQTSFEGDAASFEGSLSNELYLILAAIAAVYIVLGVLYESFVHPVTILSTLPSAGVGALLALIVAGHDLDIIGIIGIVLLIGIVKKNAIMMVDFALQAERGEGLSPREAIERAALLRFRPILMTTLAAMLGGVPLMIGAGTGSELRQPLGLAIVGGLAVSQILTIFTTPVIYLAFDRIARRLAGRRERPGEVPA